MIWQFNDRSKNQIITSLRRNEGLGLSALLLTVCLALTQSSCQQLEFVGATHADKNQGSSSDASPDSDDMVDIPVNVTGSYLACAIRKEARSDAPNLQVGCRLNDAENNQKLDLNRYTDQASWFVEPIELAEIEPVPDHPVWHVFYSFPATDNAQAMELLNQSRFTVSLQLKSIGQVMRVESPAPATLQPIENFNDFDAPVVIERGIAPETAGRL